MDSLSLKDWFFFFFSCEFFYSFILQVFQYYCLTFRISAEVSNLSNQQYDGLQKKGNENISFPENPSIAGESLNVLNQHTMG